MLHYYTQNLNCQINKNEIESINKIINKISDYFKIKITLIVKDDLNSKLHDRKLKHDFGIISLGKGLNLFKYNGSFQDNTISLAMDLTTQKQLKECTSLPDYPY